LIKGVIFDLGSTLLHFGDDWEAVARTGAEEMAEWYFKKKHIKLDQVALVEAFLEARADGRQIAYQTQAEVTAQQSLRDALKKIDAPASTDPLVEAAIKVCFGPEESVWQAYPDAVDTLKTLTSQGYRLGLYSNATDDPLVQRLINRNGLRPWLSPTFSSAGWGWRKPKPEPFNLIAQRWELSPEEIVVVGDTLNADILGAHKAGMHNVLVTMDEAPSNPDHRHIQPEAVAGTLSDLPEIITQIAQGD
jgi:HAD superfamily hydrolase (TIGR01662 family)